LSDACLFDTAFTPSAAITTVLAEDTGAGPGKPVVLHRLITP
jgi:hypothetical protein